MAIKFSKTHRPTRDKVREKKQRHDKHAARRAFMVELCGGRCRKCKTKKDLWFEWMGEGKPKENNRMTSLMSCTLKRMMAEAPNYTLLCRRHWWQKRFKAMGKKKHGTVSMYSNRESKCRCKKCRAAWNEYSKAWHKKKYAKRRVAREALKQEGFRKLFA